MKNLLALILILFFFSCDITEPDTTPPSVTITFPINESTLTEISTIMVNASDNEGVVNVSFIIDGLTVFEDSQSPYEYEWDICAYNNTQHTLFVEAKDESGNVGESDLMTFTTNAVYDCAGVCAGNSEILIYWMDTDADSLGAGEPSEFCDALVEDNWVLNNDDNDDNCLSNVHDCTGICDGDALEDICGTCDNNSGNDCIQDCIGIWGGNSADSDSDGICDWNDGDSYQTVIIGNQEWMSENLKVTHYQNGDAITHITNNGDWGSLSTGAYGDYDNNPSNSETYGRLYNWFTVDDDRGVCPVGWHVPSDNEYKELEMVLGMSQSEADDTGWRGTNEGSKLAGNASLWSSGDLENNSEFGTSGFAGFPGGYRTDYNGNYNIMGYYGYFWSSTEYYSNNAWYRKLYYDYSEVYRFNNNKKFGFSVRCVRD